MTKLHLFLSMFLWAINLAAMQEPSYLKGTLNNCGFNFSDLGEYEQRLFAELKELVENHPKEKGIPKILFVGEGFGLLPLKVIKKLEGNVQIFVNDLSEAHIKEFTAVKNNIKIGTNSSVANAARAKAVVGDCLAKTTIEHYEGNQFDIIVANNLLVFFDDKQIFDFMLLHFNLLTPGGKLFLFTDGRFELPTISEIHSLPPKSGQLYVALKNVINHRIATFAYRNSDDILFPALQMTKYLHDKFSSPDLRDALDIRYCPPMANFIFHEELEKIAHFIGYEKEWHGYYMLLAARGGYVCANSKSDKQKVGLIFQKPRTCKEGVMILESELNKDMVSRWKNSASRLQEFCNEHLIFKDSYPFVEMKSQLPVLRMLCQNPGCLKEGHETCSHCLNVRYCSKECQEHHLLQHKPSCVYK